MLQRIAAQPRADDPDRPSRLAELETLVAEHPGHPGARGAGDRPGRRRRARPRPRGARRLAGSRARPRRPLLAAPRPVGARVRPAPRSGRGRIPARLETFPHDWRSWSGLARALTRLGRDAEARQAAEAVGRIREALEPAALGPRLDDDFRHLDDPRSLRDLADLADHAGLSRLAGAWRAEAEAPATPPPGR